MLCEMLAEVSRARVCTHTVLASLTAGMPLQIAMGLRIYFDKALPQQLLYASEREQADEARTHAWLPSRLQLRYTERVSHIQFVFNTSSNH